MRTTLTMSTLCQIDTVGTLRGSSLVVFVSIFASLSALAASSQMTRRSSGMYPWALPSGNSLHFMNMQSTYRNYAACGGTVLLSASSPATVISSPRFPGSYPPNSYCKWDVKVPFGFRILVIMEEVAMPFGDLAGCTGDYVEITDFHQSHRVCNFLLGGVYLSMAPTLTLVFSSDRIREDFPARFRIRLEATSAHCGGEMTELKGQIANPDFFQTNLACSWKIRGPYGSRIFLDCGLTFWLEPSPECGNDFLALSPTGDEALKAAPRYCGTNGPRAVTSEENTMTLLFHSNSQFSYSGFRCRYQVLNSAAHSLPYPGVIPSALMYTGHATRPSSPNYTPQVPSVTPTQSTCDCGRANKMSTREARIVGGIQTPINAYPWVAAIFKNDGRQYCAGSLINDVYILTASHCVARLMPSDVFVSLGDHDLDISAETRSLIWKVRRIVVHPAYRSTPVETDDIALLELERPVPLTSSIRPICLPTGTIRMDTFNNQVPTVVGWGKLSEAGISTSVLRETTLPIRPNSECQRAYGYNVVTENMICAGQMDGTKDACQGDSGGPMMAVQGSHWYMIGLVSYGFGCARPQFPGVYTRIDRYIPWIRANMVGTATCSPNSEQVVRRRRRKLSASARHRLSESTYNLTGLFT